MGAGAIVFQHGPRPGVHAAGVAHVRRLIGLCLLTLFVLLSVAATTPAADPLPDGVVRRIGTGPVYRVRFTTAGTLMGVTGDRVLTWDPATGAELARSTPLPDLSGEFPWLSSVSRDGTRVAYLAAVSECRVHLYDLTAGLIRASYDTDTRWPYARFAAGGKLLVPRDGKVSVCDPASGAEVATLPLPVPSPRTYDTTADGRRACVGCRHAGALLLFDADTGGPAGAGTVRVGDGEVTAGSFTPDGRTVFAVAGDGTMAAWDAATGRRKWAGKVVPSGPAYGGLVFPDGRTVAVTGEDRAVRLVETSTGRVRHVFRGHTSPVYSFDVSPDGRWLAAASPDAPVYLWDVRGAGGPAGPPPDADGLARLWDDLGSPDALPAFRAVRALARHPAAAVPFLRARLAPAAGADPAAVARWVADLDAPGYAAREAATRRLKGLGELAEPAVARALAGSESAEVEARARDVLLAIPKPAAADLRALRAVEALEWAGTPGAAEVLTTLARGAEAATLTREAKAAVGRLGRRK